MTPRIPSELANARAARNEAWNEYGVVIEREHTRDEWQSAFDKAVAADNVCTELYARWQRLGGTSDIRSIVEAEPVTVTAAAAVVYGDSLLTPESTAWQKFADAQAKNFNRHYYGNPDGKPEWKR